MVNHEASRLVDWLRRSPSAFTRRELGSRWSEAAFRSAERRGLIVPVAGPFFATTQQAESLITRAHAATRWFGAGTVLTGESAAHAWGLTDRDPAKVTVSAPLGRKHSCPPWLEVTRSEVRPPSSLWFECPVAVPAWAIVAAYGADRGRRLDDLVYRAVRERIASPDDISLVLAAMPRVRARVQLEGLLARVRDGAESHLEAMALRSVFNTAEFARFVRQHWVRAQGRSFRLDMFDHATLTAIELDGAEAHGWADQREADIRRDATLARVGIATIRLSYRSVNADPAWCRATVRDVLRARTV
jgi:very-short-patch-repair endonuclease